MRLSSKFVGAVLFVLGTTTLNAADLYVATNGNDSNSGAIASPLRTISRAANMARPGDTVHVRGGVYNEIVKIMSRGTASARITFKSYAGEQAVIDGTGSAANTALVQMYEAEYVDFTGFEVRNATQNGISGYGADHIRITNNVSHSNWRNGIMMSNPSGSVARDITITGNRVYFNNVENQYHTATSGWGQGIGVFRVDGAVISDNEVFKNHGEGIDFILTDNGVAERNRVYDNYGVNIYLDNAQTVKVNRNFIYTTGDATYYRHNGPATGIAIASEAYEVSNVSSNLTITNNIVVGGRVGFYHGNSDQNVGLRNVTVANNTFYGASWALVVLGTATHTGVSVVNNIFFQNLSGDMVDWEFDGGVTFSNNNWYGAPAGAAATSSDFIGDPRMVNPGTTRPEDYKLTSSSPVVAAGANAAASTTVDYFGSTRGTSFDIGAHQLSGSGSAPSTPADTQAPSAPAGLSAKHDGGTRVVLVWAASTDNVGVKNYTVTRDGATIGTATGVTFTDPNAVAGQMHAYQVFATDAAGNRSAGSNVANLAFNSAPSGADTQAPTAPTFLRATTVTASQVSLAFRDATDNVGVKVYVIYRNGVSVGSVKGTTVWVDRDVQARTSYTYWVVAGDEAGNWSADSERLTVETPGTARRRAVR